MKLILALGLGAFLLALLRLNAPYTLLAAVVVVWLFLKGRRRTAIRGSRRFLRREYIGYQNPGEARVSRLVQSHCRAPDYQLLNHLTLQMIDGTTQIDHVLVSRFGVFVIETKDMNGWIFANAYDRVWTQVNFQKKFTFQNPIHQNYRHVCAVREVLDFLPRQAIKSVVVFCGTAEFKTPVPDGVVHLEELAEFLLGHSAMLLSQDRMQRCVSCLETSRLAVTHETDIAHVRSLARRFGGKGIYSDPDGP